MMFYESPVTRAPGSTPVDITKPLSAFGDLRTIELSPIFQYSFEYTVDNTELTVNTVTNGGTITQADGMAVLSTSTTTASEVTMETARAAKYKSGLGGVARFTTLFETGGVTGTDQYIGLRDETGSNADFKNGYVLGFDETTFGFHRFQNDVKFTIAQSAWDDPLDGTGLSGQTLDTAKLNVWYITFQYLGGGAFDLFWEDASTGDLVRVHRELYSGLNIVPSIFMPNFRLMAHADNKGTTTDLVVKTSSFSYFVEGKADPILTHQPIQTSGIRTKTNVTTEAAIFTIRNKTTYAGKTNYIEIILQDLVCSVEASSPNNLADFRVVKNATLGGSPSYTDLNTSDSVVEIDVAGTTVGNGKTIFPVPLAGKNDRIGINMVPYKIILAPGDTLTVAGASANSATLKASLLHRELF